MGAHTCQHGTVHRMCRCPTPHTIACPTPAECAPQGGKHRADDRPLGTDLTPVTLLGKPHWHGDGRECSYWSARGLWAFQRDDEWRECLRDHPDARPTRRGSA